MNCRSDNARLIAALELVDGLQLYAGQKGRRFALAAREPRRPEAPPQLLADQRQLRAVGGHHADVVGAQAALQQAND